MRCGEVQKGEEWRVHSTAGDIAVDDGKGGEGLRSGAPAPAPARGQERDAMSQAQSQCQAQARHEEGLKGPETLEDEVGTMRTFALYVENAYYAHRGERKTTCVRASFCVSSALCMTHGAVAQTCTAGKAGVCV